MPTDWPAEIEKYFPGVKGTGVDKTSEVDPDYNCIAHAAGETDRWWEPTAGAGYFWLAVASADMNFHSLVEAYQSIGYVSCEDDVMEAGFSKIALYEGPAGQWTHAAIQTADGLWSSKLGRWIDIKHDLPTHLDGLTYGRTRQFMKKPL